MDIFIFFFSAYVLITLPILLTGPAFMLSKGLSSAIVEALISKAV